MCKWGTDIKINLAYPREHSKRTYAYVDSCIAPLVQLMNDLKIHTVGCCCGHYKGEGSILIIQDDKQIEIKIPKTTIKRI